jgi:hypothetical protein
VMGGDFKSKSEAAHCARRRIDDRIEVVRDLQKVVKHLGRIAAADQLGIEASVIDQIIDRRKEISAPLLTAMYGAGGARLLPSLAPRDALDAGVAKIVAACAARAPVAPVARSMPFDMAKSPKPPAGVAAMGPRDLGAHECKILAEVGTDRSTLVAILRRVRDAAGNWAAAGVELGLGKSTVMNLAGGHSKFSFRVAQLLLEWNRANPVSTQDAAVAQPAPSSPSADAAGREALLGVPLADRGAAEVPPPATVSTAAPPVASDLSPVIGTVDERAAADGAAGSPPHSPPQNTLIAANDDPFAAALTALLTARDAAQAARIAIRAELVGIEAQIVPLQERRVQLIADEAGLLSKLVALCMSVYSLQATAK